MNWLKKLLGGRQTAAPSKAPASSGAVPQAEGPAGAEDSVSGRPYRLLTPRAAEPLGAWARAFPAYEEIVGYSLLGHFFMRNPQANDYMVLHPFKGAAKSYGQHLSVEDVERDVLNEPGFASYVLRAEHVDAIRQLLGAPGADEIYIPQPYPFLGGTEEPDTYSTGNVWVFMDIVAQMRGLEA